jgi:hypothetical protein
LRSVTDGRETGRAEVEQYPQGPVERRCSEHRFQVREVLVYRRAGGGVHGVMMDSAVKQAVTQALNAYINSPAFRAAVARAANNG